jgi:DNA-binding IclR family transcriptional regulator
VSLIAPKLPRGPNSPVKVKLPSERRSLSRSATRALDVMELFGAMRCPLRAVEIGRALSTNPSTTNQLLKTMVDSGHLFFDARAKTYLPSPRLAEFGGWMSDAYGAGGRLRDLVRDVRMRTGMVVTVSTPNDLFMQIVESAIPAGQTAERGLRVSVFGSAIGSAYLSMLDRSEVVRLAQRARIPDRDIERIVEETEQIRRDGSADGASMDETIWSLALPLPPCGFSVPLVLGLAGPSDEVRAKLAAFRQVMTEAIGRELGEQG